MTTQLLAEHGIGILWDPGLDTAVQSWMEVLDLKADTLLPKAFTLATSGGMEDGYSDTERQGKWNSERNGN